jgi:hypothetical protein
VGEIIVNTGHQLVQPVSGLGLIASGTVVSAFLKESVPPLIAHMKSIGASRQDVELATQSLVSAAIAVSVFADVKLSRMSKYPNVESAFPAKPPAPPAA